MVHTYDLISNSKTNGRISECNLLSVQKGQCYLPSTVSPIKKVPLTISISTSLLKTKYSIYPSRRIHTSE